MSSNGADDGTIEVVVKRPADGGGFGFGVMGGLHDSPDNRVTISQIVAGKPASEIPVLKVCVYVCVRQLVVWVCV